MREQFALGFHPADEVVSEQENKILVAERFCKGIIQHYGQLLFRVNNGSKTRNVDICVDSVIFDNPKVLLLFENNKTHGLHVKLELEEHMPRTWETLENTLWQPKYFKIGEIVSYDNDFDFEIVGPVRIIDNFLCSTLIEFKQWTGKGMLDCTNWVYYRRLMTREELVRKYIAEGKINEKYAEALIEDAKKDVAASKSCSK